MRDSQAKKNGSGNWIRQCIALRKRATKEIGAANVLPVAGALFEQREMNRLSCVCSETAERRSQSTSARELQILSEMCVFAASWHGRKFELVSCGQSAHAGPRRSVYKAFQFNPLLQKLNTLGCPRPCVTNKSCDFAPHSSVIWM